MNIVADECCDALLVGALRNAGHDVLYIKEFAPGSEDITVLQLSVEQDRILLSEDKDFGELVVRLRLRAYGVVLLRVHSTDSTVKFERLRELFQNHSHRLAGSFVVVDEAKTRFRPL